MEAIVRHVVKVEGAVEVLPFDEGFARERATAPRRDRQRR